MSSVTPRRPSVHSPNKRTQLVSCKTAVSHAWLILPTSPAGCGHMSSPAGTFCPAPPRISSLRARGFSGRPSQFGSREKMRSGAVGFWSQPSVVAAVVTGGWSAASAISDMLSRLRAGKFGALVTMLHFAAHRESFGYPLLSVLLQNHFPNFIPV